MSTEHQALIEIFKSQIKGRAVTNSYAHDGEVGHWLERQFGQSANNDPHADWNGYELKSGKGKVTFGDWSAESYIWQINPAVISDRNDFLRVFGNPYQGPETRKLGRYSWSGTVAPKIGDYNECGQRLEVGPAGDIFAVFDFQYDLRADKAAIVPVQLQSGKIILARWGAEKCAGDRATYIGLRKRVEIKFGNKGWVKFVQDSADRFVEMWIGGPFTFEKWIDDVRAGIIFLDSGMNEGTTRLRQQWRAPNSYWEGIASHIIR